MAKIKWRVQVRKSRKHAWRYERPGYFTVRWLAREYRTLMRDYFGFGNTRVVAVRGKK